MTHAQVQLREWEQADPDQVPLLRKRRLPRDAAVRALADGLTASARLRITELA
jgi:hypothetical protein